MRVTGDFGTIFRFLFTVASLCPALAWAGDKLEMEKQHFEVPYVNAPIDVDARLDEGFWQNAVKIDANIEVRPGENIPAPVKTEALLVHNDTHIYVAIVAYDPDPSAIRAHLCDRDELWNDDWVLILFDTFNDQRRTYDFFCNPLGIQADEIETPQGGGGGWDAIWESDGRITDEGYIVEMSIPFSSFSFPRSEGELIWGFDVVRSYPRNVRHHIGAFPRDRNNNCYMCQSHKLIGFAGLTPGKNVEFDPTMTAVTTRERQDDNTGPFNQSSSRFEPGITSHWRFTPNLTLNATVNPDFSNVEADAAQMDINRQFTLYYGEKRPFFLEGADFFQTSFTTVHTRTLADPRWGLKITGKEGQTPWASSLCRTILPISLSRAAKVPMKDHCRSAVSVPSLDFAVTSAGLRMSAS
jgi:hypothetical protein